MTKLIFLPLLALVIFAPATTQAQTVFDFENLILPAAGFNNGDPDATPLPAVVDVTGETPFPFGIDGGVIRQVDQTFTFSQNGFDVTLPNSYSEAEGFDDFFSGFSFSNVQDVATPGPDNRYASFTGGGAGGSSNYLVASGDTSITTSGNITSIDIAPTTFTALAILDGDDGGSNFISGSLPDLNGFLELVISGNNSSDQITVSFGDYRNGASIAPSDQFQTIDVSSLNSSTLNFSYEGSDVLVDQDGNPILFNGLPSLNTPAFFAADNIVVSVPEPAGLGLVSLIGMAVLSRRRVRK